MIDFGFKGVMVGWRRGEEKGGGAYVDPATPFLKGKGEQVERVRGLLWRRKGEDARE